MARIAASESPRERESGASALAGSPTSPLAIAAAFAAFFSIVCPPFGVVAVVLARIALSRVRDGFDGERLARTAFCVGAATTAVTLFAVGWLCAGGRVALTDPPATTPIARHVSVPSGPLVSDPAIQPLLHVDAGQASLKETRIGQVVLVDLGPAIFSLAVTLDEQQAIAERTGDRLLLWIVGTDCQPCRDVAKALEDARMQAALAGVRLVRLDMADFVVELGHISVPVDTLPGFALMDRNRRVTDYVHGGEWDEDIPANIAPVLQRFVEGTYTHRRFPWRGGPRDDETPI